MCKFARLSLLVFSIGLPATSAFAATTDIEQLKQELKAMREAYESRIQQLESRIATLAEKQTATEKKVEKTASRPVATASPKQGMNSFNPEIGVILNGKFNSYSRNPDNYALPGFQLGGEAGLRSEGFTADETEVNFSGNIDDRFYGSVTAALVSEDGETAVELEEAYIDSMGLPAGFGVKAGRFYSDIGYLNRQHSHTWDFVDQPLVYRAFLAEQYSDDGVQVRWLAPTDTFIELGGEYLRGAGFPAGGSDNDGKGVYSLFAHVGGDIGVSYNWRVGLSTLRANAREREGVDSSLFSGDSNLWIADFVLKWAPNGNPTEQNLKLQAEYFQRREDGTISVSDGADVSSYRGKQHGWYTQAVYQFMPRWRIGARYDHLSSNNRGNDESVLTTAGLDDNYDPSRFSTMLDYSRNEFNRIRFQYNRDKSRPGSEDNQFSIQYIMSFGAHGGHQF